MVQQLGQQPGGQAGQLAQRLRMPDLVSLVVADSILMQWGGAMACACSCPSKMLTCISERACGCTQICNY